MAILAIVTGGVIYSNEKVKLAQDYYDKGEYKEAADLNVGEISNHARVLYAIVSLTTSAGDKKTQRLLSDITLIHNEIKNSNTAYKVSNKDYFDILINAYKDFADCYKISTAKLDKIAEMNTSEGLTEINNLLK